MTDHDPQSAFGLDRILLNIPEPANGETYTRFELRTIVVAAIREAAAPVISVSVRAADA